MNVSAAGMAWYDRKDYSAILRIMTDAKTMPPNYDEWLHKAQMLEQDLQRKGHVIKRAKIEPDLFAVWCRDHNLVPNAQARARFAGDYVYMSLLQGD